MGDKGHEQLVKDLTDLLHEAKNYEFHDFKNDKYAAPKMKLAEILAELRNKVIDGTYDN